MARLLAVALALLVAGCGFPRDSGTTLDDVRGGVLRVEWHTGSDSELMGALKHRVLDLVVGGLTDDAPWVKEASLTRPYVRIRTVVAARPGVTVPEDLAGTRVAARAGTEDIALLTKHDAVPVAVADPAAERDLPVVLDEWEVGPAGLTASRHTLAEHKRTATTAR